VHDGIGIREIVLSANGELDSIDDLPPYLNAALSEALTQFQDEVVTELGRAWPELPLTGGLALRGTTIDGEVLARGLGTRRTRPSLCTRYCFLNRCDFREKEGSRARSFRARLGSLIVRSSWCW
jgi:hypothetical protein